MARSLAGLLGPVPIYPFTLMAPFYHPAALAVAYVEELHCTPAALLDEKIGFHLRKWVNGSRPGSA
ncbi:MAG: hypothetical protein RL497_1683 [Pseudomonadota bacterium]|jgi:hypothetical protein